MVCESSVVSLCDLLWGNCLSGPRVLLQRLASKRGSQKKKKKKRGSQNADLLGALYGVKLFMLGKHFYKLHMEPFIHLIIGSGSSVTGDKSDISLSLSLLEVYIFGVKSKGSGRQ